MKTLDWVVDGLSRVRVMRLKRMLFHCLEHHKQNSIHLHCIKAALSLKNKTQTN